MQRRSMLAIGCILAVTSCSGGNAAENAEPPAPATPAPGSLSAAGEPDVEALRAATERFRDVGVALAEGYIPDPSGMCVTAAMEGRPAEEGAMGIHYLRPDLLGLARLEEGQRVNGNGTHTDFTRPAILLYEPQTDGSLELVGIENLVFQESWAAAGNSAPPTFHNTVWNAMADDPATEQDEAHGFEPHYDMHAWIFRDNPDGMFMPFNPSVTCAHQAHAQM